MTALVILIVIIILLWLIGQGVVLALLWGQQQRSDVRTEALARLVGLSRPVDHARTALDEPVASGFGSATAAPVAIRTPPLPALDPEPEAAPPELTFPPPVRQPAVPSARVPIPRVEDHASDPRGESMVSSAPAEAVSAPDAVLSPGDLDRGGNGLPAGTMLPDFELTTIDGRRYGRSALLGSRPVMLFLAVDSPGSAAVMESIRSPQVRKRSLPDLLLVIDGGVEVESLRRWLGKLPKRVTILLQEDTELATVLRVAGTPSAYVLDSEGRTKGPLRTGARAVLEALGVGVPQMSASARRSTSATPHPQVTQRSYSGLPVGSSVPDVQVPLLNGGAWERSESRAALLIFWDLDCAPCRTMESSLLQQARTWSGFDRVLITRGARPGDERLGAINAHLPVAIQHGFDLSRRFQVLETPAALAIAPDGTVARPPAIGENAVMALAADLRQRSRRNAVPGPEGGPT